MRVLHVVGPTERGGAQTQLLGVIRAAIAAGLWQPHLVSLAAGLLLPDFEATGIPVLSLRRRGSPGLLRLHRLRRYIRAGDFDVVHALLPGPIGFAELAVAGWRDRPAVVVSERGIDPVALPRRVVERFLGRWADVHAPNGDAVAAVVRSRHPGHRPIVVVPNGVDRCVFHSKARAPIPRRVGTIGRLVPAKGFDVLIAAVRQLVDEGVDVSVQIAGEGPRAGALRAAAAGLPVTFLGSLAPGAAVAEFLNTLALFVLPSRYGEGQPNVVLEALACGAPVIATDIPGVGETARGAAVLVPKDDARALAQAIRAALDDDDAGGRSVPAAALVPSLEDAAESHLKVFETAVVQRRRRG